MMAFICVKYPLTGRKEYVLNHCQVFAEKLSKEKFFW